MTAQELIELMEEREDLYIVVDTKETETVQIVHDLLQLAENRPDIVDRFVIQLYDKGAKESFLELYPFTNENFLFTCYKFGYDHKAVLSLCMEEDISVVTVTHDVWDSSVIDLFTQKGILVYEHTVNRPDHVQESLKKGVHGFYTDFLTILEP
jgi:glycerophosphoryl diester phosphodiesterase